MRFLLTFFLVAIFLTAWSNVRAQDIQVFAGAWSKHIGADAPNEVHQPFGLEIMFDERFGIARFNYLNSFGKNSEVLSVVNKWKYFILYTGAVTGYSEEYALPIILPMARFKWKIIEITGACLPGMGWTCALILKVSLM